MLSPSFDRGVDLPEVDGVAAVIVAKMPYMNLMDPQVKARMALPGGSRWYALNALRTLIQECGRAMRSNTQKCDTYIFDANFSRLRNQMRDVIPLWWLKAVQDVPVSQAELFSRI
jgi:Rad3-related DNA helicase